MVRGLPRKPGKVWREHGALECRGCVTDELMPGQHTASPQSVDRLEGEAVMFVWIVCPSRQDRDHVGTGAGAVDRVAQRRCRDWRRPENLADGMK